MKCVALLQHGANLNIRNSEQKTPLDLADENTRPVLTGEYRKDELLDAARSGAEDRLLPLLTPLNVNCHASDGRRSTPLHLAAGYNRISIVQILLQHGADVHAKDKGGLVPLHNACSYGEYSFSYRGVPLNSPFILLFITTVFILATSKLWASVNSSFYSTVI